MAYYIAIEKTTHEMRGINRQQICSIYLPVDNALPSTITHSQHPKLGKQVKIGLSFLLGQLGWKYLGQTA